MTTDQPSPERYSLQAGTIRRETLCIESDTRVSCLDTEAVLAGVETNFRFAAPAMSDNKCLMGTPGMTP